MTRLRVAEFFMRGAHRPQRSAAERAGVALGWLALFTALRWLADPAMVLPTPYVFYLPAIVLTTAMCGARWGYGTVAVSLALTVYLWVPPRLSFRLSKTADLYDVIVWAVVSCGIVAILAALDAAAARLADQSRQLADKSRALEAQTAALEQSQAQLRTYTLDLERLVGERTVKLTEAMAELESFSYTISHDLRSPVRTMQGFSQLVLEESGDALDAQTLDYVRRIDRAAHRMDDLLQDLLLFTRAGRSGRPAEAIDLGGLIDDLLQRNPQWSEQGAEFEIRRPLLAVHGVRGALGQSLANLIDNAVKFVAAGRRPHIRIWTERRGRHVRLQIADNGIGMRREFLTQIFKPFYRGHPEGRYAGRGIGLAVAKKNIVHMGGDIGVATEPDAGAVFWIELPAAESPA